MFWLLGHANICWSQLDATAYEDFSQTIVNPYIINPSSTDTSYIFKVRLNNINGLGVTRNVGRFYLDADKRFGAAKSKGFHNLGLQITNLKLGDYISKSRFQLRYSWYTRLSEQSAVSAGVSLGFINYSFLTTQGGTGGTDLGPDGSVGVHFFAHKFNLGFAIQQIFNPVLIPINQSFQLSRLYNVDLEREFSISPFADLTAQVVLQISDDSRYTYGASLLSELYDFGIIGLSNFYLKKTSVSAGIKPVVFTTSTLTLLVTYNMYHGEIPLPDNTLEIFLGFDI